MVRAIRDWWRGRRAEPEDGQRLVLGLLGVARGLTSAASLNERLTHLCRMTVELLHCDRSSIFLLEDGYYRARYNHGNPPEIARVFHSHRVRLDDPLIAKAMELRSFVIVNEPGTSPIMDPRTARRAGIQAIVVAPLLEVDERPLGFVTAEYNQNPGRFSELSSTLVLGLAKLAELVLQTDRLDRQRLHAERQAAELESRVSALQRLEAMGRLSAGVAHDFNNILTAVLGHCDTLESLSGEPRVRSEIAGIKEAAQRAAALTGQLLAFGRRQVREPRVIDLGQSVRTLLPMLERLMPENLRIRFYTAPDLGRVRSDPSQLEQVLMNLALNARDAMPTGGLLTIETANVELDEEACRGRPGARPGRYVLLAVTDTGVGMPPEVAHHVFEPFFTTRQEAGSGLGLATVYGIVKQSGGSVWVYSEPGQGTSFKVYLPRIDAELDPLPPVLDAGRAHGDETILVVDDDASVRRVVRVGLSALGYTVLDAASGSEAIDLSRSHEGSIDLMLTDVVMPGLHAGALVGAIRKQRGEIQVLYMSGYAENSVVRNGILDGGVAFISKPFKPLDLARKIRQVLDHARR